MVVAPGSKLPAFELTAAVSERVVSPQSLAGCKTIYVVHGPKTTDAPKDVGKAVRAKWPSADDVLVVNIVDLRKMGGMWAKLAKAQMKQTYEKLAAKIPERPEDYILICADWDGQALAALGVDEPDRQAAVLVVAADGTIIASAEGDGLIDCALTE